VIEPVAGVGVMEVIAMSTMRSSASVAVTVREPAEPWRSESGAPQLALTAASSTDVLVIEMSSTPTHSSLPVASAVMIRTSTYGWSLTAAGRTTFTGVTRVARLGPVVASAT
jgi:hypothetical protein